MPKIVLKCNNISKKINKRIVVDNFSLDLYEGDILGFVGPNGAGKTTTIKLILGLEKLDSGSVEINGFNLKENFCSAISEVGAIIENPDMYMYLSGYENLMISAKIYNIEKHRVKEVVDLVGLTNRINDKVKKYSLGMRQRLGIAQAILHKPKLLILDEPTNGLDPEGINDMRNLLIELAQTEKMAIIVSSHILRELESFCNKICIIKDGSITCNTTMNALKQTNTNINYTIEVNNINLEKILNNYEVIDDNHIKLVGDKSKIVNVIKTLILNNIDIYEIKQDKISLEELFLAYTEKKPND